MLSTNCCIYTVSGKK